MVRRSFDGIMSESRSIVFDFDSPRFSRIHDEIEIKARLLKSMFNFNGKAESFLHAPVFQLFVQRIVFKRDQMIQEAAVQGGALLNVIERHIIIALGFHGVFLNCRHHVRKGCIFVNLDSDGNRIDEQPRHRFNAVDF